MGIGREEVDKILKELYKEYPCIFSNPKMNDYDEEGIPYWERWQKKETLDNGNV